MNIKTSKKMRGFMCQSPAATAVCMIGDHRSVVVPRRPDRTLVDHAMLNNNNNKYSRLVESRRFSTLSDHRRPIFNVSSINMRDRDRPHRPTVTCTPPPPTSLPSSDQLFQVVVMRVSLHCQGCAGKVKKHLSKMEGVTSFSIDLETKRVIVRGQVSPDGVLESISKVKKAEFWPS